MSRHPQATYLIPEETQRIARAAFPRGNLYMQVADRLGTIYQDAQFAALFPRRGQPAEAPARLALVTVLQFAEGFSDRQAADAVRSRIDWKYVLGLELADPGFHHTVLSEFRTRLVAGEEASHLLDALLTLARTQGLLKTRGRQRTDSTYVVAAIRILNRLERVGETLRAALNSLAIVAPAWLQALAPLEWYDRYSRRVENYQLPKMEEARKALAAVIGADGQTLLHAIATAVDQPWLQEVPAVKTLQQVWAEQYFEVNGRLSWREVKDMPSPAELIASPYDPEARYSTKREVEWVGYKVHLTETCESDTPHLIVNVETTPATTPDDHMLKRVHASLEQQGLLPTEHSVDKGYTDSQVLVESQRTCGVTLIGPVVDDPSWQARTGTGFDKSQFLVDWDHQVVIQVIVESDQGETQCVEDVAEFKRGALQPDTLRLTLAEANALLQGVQRTIVAEQTTTYLEAHRPCPACQAPRRCKGHHQLVYRTVFGKLTLSSPRWYMCRCQTTKPRSFSPLADLLPKRTAPELLYLEAKFAALMSYGVTVDVLGELLPIGTQLNATTVQRHLLRVAERMEHELGEEQVMFVEGCPAEWERLPPPDVPLTVGLDGGYVHARDDRSRKAGWFEVIVGKSLPDEGASKCFDFVHTYDTKPKRRLFEVLKS